MSTQAASPNSSSLVHTPHSSHLGTQRKQPLHLRVTKLAHENMTCAIHCSFINSAYFDLFSIVHLILAELTKYVVQINL
uniref:Uncharacterized protein n=1 Tax=Solanum tuberosum TaxID=4113 RepID=M1D5A1_SOLTU